MSPLDVLGRCLRAGIILTVDGGRLAYDAPAGALTHELLDALKAHKAAVIAILEDQRSAREPAALRLHRGGHCQICPGPVAYSQCPHDNWSEAQLNERGWTLEPELAMASRATA